MAFPTFIFFATKEIYYKIKNDALFTPKSKEKWHPSSVQKRDFGILIKGEKIMVRKLKTIMFVFIG